MESKSKGLSLKTCHLPEQSNQSGGRVKGDSTKAAKGSLESTP